LASSLKVQLFEIMSIAKERVRRNNAGSRMARLLNEEEEDEFYTTTYGGFDETEGDNDYK